MLGGGGRFFNAKTDHQKTKTQSEKNAYTVSGELILWKISKISSDVRF